MYSDFEEQPSKTDIPMSKDRYFNLYFDNPDEQPLSSNIEQLLCILWITPDVMCFVLAMPLRDATIYKNSSLVGQGFVLQQRKCKKCKTKETPCTS